MIEFHDLSPEEEQKVKELLDMAESSAQQGPQSIESTRAANKENTPPLFSVTTGMTFDENGNVTQNQTTELAVLKCGCLYRSGQQVIECSNSGELICPTHTLYCHSCKRPVWVHHAKTFKQQNLCTNCIRKAWGLFLPNLVWLLLKTVLVGFCGKKLEEKPQSHSLSPPELTGGFDERQLSEHERSQLYEPRPSLYPTSDRDQRKTGWNL